MIPRDIHASLERYVNDRVPPGGFLYAVLCNDLEQTLARADEDNLAALKNIVTYVVMHLPRTCRGNSVAIRRWLAREEVRCAECDAPFGRCSCVDSEPAITA